MQLATTAPARTSYTTKFADCLRIAKNKSITEWTIDQLDIRPYQHILEIGYASGYTLQEVARKLKIGFLAGIDESITMYRQAYRRNKKLVQDQLLQLHIGSIHELPYPHYYFHTIYANNITIPGKHTRDALMQLFNLLRHGGKMVIILKPSMRDEIAVMELAEKLKQDYLQAGFCNVQVEWHEMGLAVAGNKD